MSGRLDRHPSGETDPSQLGAVYKFVYAELGRVASLPEPPPDLVATWKQLSQSMCQRIGKLDLVLQHPRIGKSMASSDQVLPPGEPGPTRPRTVEATARIRVYLINDNPIMREGFVRALAGEPDIVVVGQAETAALALKEAPFSSPDVILVDPNMPNFAGDELIALTARMPEVKLLLLFNSSTSTKEVLGGIRSAVRGPP